MEKVRTCSRKHLGGGGGLSLNGMSECVELPSARSRGHWNGSQLKQGGAFSDGRVVEKANGFPARSRCGSGETNTQELPSRIKRANHANPSKGSRTVKLDSAREGVTATSSVLEHIKRQRGSRGLALRSGNRATTSNACGMHVAKRKGPCLTQTMGLLVRRNGWMHGCVHMT